MTRTRPARAEGSSGSSPLRTGLIIAGIILTLGLLAQGWAWIDPPPPPAEGPVSTEVTTGGVAAAAAVILLWVMLPAQVLVTVVFLVVPSLRRDGQRGRR